MPTIGQRDLTQFVFVCEQATLDSYDPVSPTHPQTCFIVPTIGQRDLVQFVFLCVFYGKIYELSIDAINESLH